MFLKNHLHLKYLMFLKNHLNLMFLMNQMFPNYLKFHLFLNPLPLKLLL